ncbi:MAG TPA: hypothetical protein VM285_10130 [Polyangia bacterium]|nr:hypothetical protein [Polyangia bacterium]
MSLLWIVIALVVVGGLCCWVAGLLQGSRGVRAAPASDADIAALVRNRNGLRENLLRAHERIGRFEGQLSEERAARRAAEEELGRAEVEMERAAGELGRAEAELDQSGLEIARFEARLAAATLELADKPTMPPDPLPGSSVPPTTGQAGLKRTMAIGFLRESTPPATSAAEIALADLDLERVSHAMTRQALDEAQAKIEILERDCERAASTPLPPRPDRKGAGFQTVSIASRDQAVPGFEHDRLRRVHEQLRLEKEQLEAEHAAALARLSQIEEEPGAGK